MTTEELNNKIQAIKDKATAQIQLLKREFEVTKKTPNVKCSVFDTFSLFECDTKEHIKEVLTAYPADDDGKPNPFYGYEKIPYNFSYQIGIDNNYNNIVGRINYSNLIIGKIWIRFNPAILNEYLNVTSRKVYETELVHFPGLSIGQIGKLRALSFGDKAIGYYGGDEKLKCEETARMIISQFLD